MILNNLLEYIELFGDRIGYNEPDFKLIYSMWDSDGKYRLFDISDIDGIFLNQLIDESIETGIDKVYDAVKEYEIEMPKHDPNCIY